MCSLLLATTSADKAREFRDILALFPELAALRVAMPGEVGLSLPAVEETGATFAANACLKARSASLASGLPSLADDSGLCVDALGGAPGLLSARWAGPDAADAERTALLLGRLADVPAEARGAQFVCAAALALPGGMCIAAEGVCAGEITPFPRGANGFGYDPIFLLPALGRTMAEVSDAEKHSLSHRALAVRGLLPHLATLLENAN